MFAARLLGMPEHSVRVITRDVGGGFGQKVMPLREDICVLLAARKLPCRGQVDRGPPGEPAVRRARHGTSTARRGSPSTTEGTILAASLDHVQDVGAYPTPWPVGTGAATGMIFPGPYRVARGTFSHASVFSNTPGRIAYRGPWAFETLAREVTLDIAARRMGIDPAELRRRNLLRRDEMPYPSPTGMPYDHMDPLETLEQALAILGYDAFREPSRQPPASRAATWALGSPATPSRRRPRSATTRPRARRYGSSRQARSTSTWPAARQATAWRRRRCSLPRTRSGPTSRTCTRFRATPLSRRSARAPAAAAAAR